MKKLLPIKQIAVLSLAFITAGTEIAFAAPQAEKTEFRYGFSSVAAKATPAVVFISVEKEVSANMNFFNNPFDFFNDEWAERFFNGREGGFRRFRERRPERAPRKQMRQAGQGSGFLISKDGYILTNTHVVGDADRITVKLNDGKEYSAKRIGADPKTEVAVIKIESEKELPYLQAGDPEKLMTGEWVVAIGNPFGLKETLTVGVVSAKGRNHMGITDYEDFIQTDAAINPGNSGGPLLNIDGEVVGINTAIYSRSGGYMGIGFAVPIDMAMNVKDQIVKNGHVTRGYIGVMLNPGNLTPEMGRSLGYTGQGGVLIAEALKDSPAEKAGIKAGDIITELNGKKMVDGMQFRNEVARILPNTKAKITFVREGIEKTVEIKVESFPDDEKGSSAVDTGECTSILENTGMEVQDLTKEIAKELDLEGVKSGAVVTDVEPGSDAARAGIEAGMVIIEANRKPVKGVEDLKKCAAKIKEGNILLRVKTQKGTIFINLPLAKK